MSSVSVLLQPETKLQQWSALNCYSLSTHNLEADEVEIKELVVDDLEVKDLDVVNLIVQDSALIGGVDYVTLNGVGLANQSLTSLGNGTIQWVSNGNGNVVGPLVSVLNDIPVFADTTGLLLSDSGVNIADVLVSPLSANLDGGDNAISNLQSVALTDQAIIVPPAVGQTMLYSSNIDSRLYSLNGALQTGKLYEWTLDVDQELKTNSNAQFNGLEISGGSMILNDGVAAGSETINFQSAGVPDKYIDCSAGVMTIKNNAFANILSMNDAKDSEFFGDLKVDGALDVADWSNLYLGNGVIYQPGGVSDGKNLFATWAEVVIAVNNCNQCTTIYVDDSIVSPALITSNLNCQGRVSFKPYLSNINAGPSVQFNSDIQLTDPASFVGISSIIGNTTLNSNIILTNGSLLTFFEGANLTNTVGSLLPIISIADGDACIIAFYLGSKMNTSNVVSIVNVGIGSTLIVSQINMSQSLGNDVISSTDATANLLNQFDASFTSPWTNVAFTGIITNQLLDKSLGVSYDDTVTPPLLVANNVQDALDYFKLYGKSITLSFSGNIAAPPLRANFLDSSASVTTDVLGVSNSCVVPSNSLVMTFAYNTSSGDGTSLFEIYKNGVGSGPFAITGLSGVVDVSILSIGCTAGDSLSIRQNAGTAAGISNYSLLLVTNP